jgi:hypothetical protein
MAFSSALLLMFADPTSDTTLLLAPTNAAAFCRIQGQ